MSLWVSFESTELFFLLSSMMWDYLLYIMSMFYYNIKNIIRCVHTGIHVSKHTDKGQKTVLAVSPYLPACLRWALFCCSLLCKPGLPLHEPTRILLSLPHLTMQTLGIKVHATARSFMWVLDIWMWIFTFAHGLYPLSHILTLPPSFYQSHFPSTACICIPDYFL